MNILNELNKLGTKITKKGSRYFICCPFHQEDTPSCLINVNTNSFYCFGCGESGDTKKLIEEITGEKIIEENKKVNLPAEIEVNNFFAKYYKKSLTETIKGEKVMKDYLKRGVNEKVIDYFNLGFASDENVVKQILKELNKTTDTPLLNCDKDFFKNRLLFPIADIKGNVLGFTGRTVGNDDIKYLNTPETPCFKKGDILYNINKAYKEIKKTKKVYIVEGTFDVIAYFLCGYKNVVSPLTCKMTKKQILYLQKEFGLDLEYVIAFDNDEAGKKGIKKTLEIFKELSIWNYKIIRYNFKDASLYIELQKEKELKKTIENALSIGEYLKEFYKRGESNKSKNIILNEFLKSTFYFPDFVLKVELNKFSFEKEFLLKQILKQKNNTFDLILYQIKEDKEKMRLFRISVNENILTSLEKKKLKDDNGIKNSYKFSLLLSTFIQKRCQDLLKEEIF